MAYTFKKEGANIAVFQNGQRIATTTENQAAIQFGYGSTTPTQGTTPAPTPTPTATPSATPSASGKPPIPDNFYEAARTNISSGATDPRNALAGLQALITAGQYGGQVDTGKLYAPLQFYKNGVKYGLEPTGELKQVSANVVGGTRTGDARTGDTGTVYADDFSPDNVYDAQGNIVKKSSPGLDFTSIIGSDPFLSDMMNDPTQSAMFDALPDEFKNLFLTTASALGRAVSAGQVINPNIEITPEQNRQFIDQASKELDPYYQEQLTGLKQDFETSISRLMEDYTKGATRANETLKLALGDQAEAEAQAGTAFSSGRVNRQDRTLQIAGNELNDSAQAAGRVAQDAATGYERKVGSNALRSLNIPSLSTYGASTSGVAPTSTRSLYLPFGNVAIGTENAKRETAIATRRSQLEEAFRTGRNLDLATLS